MRIGVAATKIPFLRGCSERRSQELLQMLRTAGHEAELIPIPFSGHPDHKLAEQMLACRLLDLEESMGIRIDRLVGLTFPAYLVPHSAKVIWLLRQGPNPCTLGESLNNRLSGTTQGELLHRFIRQADAHAMSFARHVFVPSREAAAKLHASCGVAATPLYVPPVVAEDYGRNDDGDFLLLPADYEDVPRQDLVLQAARRTRHPVRVRILAPGPAFSSLARSAQDTVYSLEGRIVQKGASNRERRTLFGSCLAVVYTPQGETDNIVAFEAMLSEKALVTCNDAGGVAELVQDGETGYVCSPDPDALAAIFDRLWENRTLTRRLGRMARISYQDLRLSWEQVLERLLA